MTIPPTATSFSLTVTYKAGYSTSKNGSIQQVDLVPNFSLTPNPVLKSASLTLRNLMQKAAAATLNSVDLRDHSDRRQRHARRLASCRSTAPRR